MKLNRTREEWALGARRTFVIDDAREDIATLHAEVERLREALLLCEGLGEDASDSQHAEVYKRNCEDIRDIARQALGDTHD